MEEEDEIGLNGTTNPEEAREHTDTLDDTLEKLEEDIREGVTENTMRKMIIRFRKAIIKITPSMEEENADTVLNSLKDITCTALMPQTEERDERLEEIMPEEELPSASDIIMQAQELEDLTLEQREQITELFDELEVAHDTLAKVSRTLARLSRSLSGKQLLTVLTSSIRPHPNKCLGKLLERSICKPNSWKISTRGWSCEQPNTTIGSYFSVQVVKEIWWQYNSERDTREIWSEAETTGPMYNWQKVPRKHRQEVSGQKTKSHQ